MATLRHMHRRVQLDHFTESRREQLTETPLTSAERKRVALAALTIQEQRFRLKLVQIQHERRVLMAGQAQ